MIRIGRHRACLLAGSLFFASGFAHATVESYTPGDQNDPRIRAARFLGEDKRHFSALTELLKMQYEAPAPTAPQFPWLLADNYLAFGLRERADAIYQPLGITTNDPVQFARAQLRLAEFEYTRGYLPEAHASLLRMREKLPTPLLLDWQDLMVRVAMAQDHYAEAVDELTGAKNASDQTPYMRYNLGIALIKNGRVDEGRTVLDKVGGIKPIDRDTLALKDRANMTLGWDFLQARESAAARPVLERVRVEGPYSNRALLGLGWSELLPNGATQLRKDVSGADQPSKPFESFSTLGVMLRKSLTGDLFSRRTFKSVEGSSDEAKALNEALPAWLTLIDRDPQDPAVQEGWLAIPYALDQLDAHDQARSFFEQAVDRLEAAHVRTVAALEALKTNRMVETIVKRDLDAESGWDWEIKDLPDAPETYYLQTLLAENRFAEGLKNYRDMRLLQRNMESWDKRLGNLEKVYGNVDRASVDPRVLIARARENHVSERLEVKIDLAIDDKLHEPGHYKQNVEAPTRPPALLRMAAAPATFTGTYEDIGALHKRLTSLLPALTKAGDQQGLFLQRIANRELQAQKDTIEKYLVEARFALARLYDRQLNSSDPDEHEIKK